MVHNAYAIPTDPNIILTPFDISFSEKDFTKTGPYHHILILKPGDNATISVKIKNHDTIQHQITFRSPDADFGYLFDSYYFEPETVLVKPNSEQETLLHMKIKTNTEIHMSVVPLLAQSKSFGMVGKYFYVVIAEKDKITEADLTDVDHSLREGLPGPAFPDLYNDFRTQQPELQNVLDTITINKFGVPRYLPNGYSFQGLTTPYPHPGFIYAPTKVTNTTESIIFWRSGGLFVGYEANTLNFNLTTWLPAFVAQNEAQQIIVNGLVGAAAQQQDRVTIDGHNYKFPAEIALFDKYSEIYLRGNMPLAELLKVAASVPVPVTENPPLIISKVELWGPPSFIANNVKSCIDKTVEQLGPWAIGWIEIQNTKDKTITAKDIALRTGSIGSIIPIILGPNESCVIQTEDQITTRIGPGGSEGNGPPYGYDGFATVFEYFVEENGKKIHYVDTTPELSDTHGDTRIWQLVDGKWIFKENPVKDSSPHLSPLKQFKSGIAAVDIHCKENLQLVIKARDGSPVCVKPATVQKLVERGWAFEAYPSPTNNSNEASSKGTMNVTNSKFENNNETGIVTIKNQTYYFDTPNYTENAYFHPVQISFHDVVFTLFPPGFRGGLPTDFGGVATNGCGGSYYWTDAKFPDGIHELLDIFAISQYCSVHPIPTYFSNHTNPQAGLTFYDGKMKLLVREQNQTSQLDEFDGVVIDQSLSASHVYYFFTNDTSVKFNTGSEGIRLEGIDNIDDLDGKHVKIFGIIQKDGEDKIKVGKFQILGTFIPKSTAPRNMIQKVSFDDLFSNPDRYYNQTIAITGKLREHDYPLGIAGVGCYSAEFTTSDEFVPDFVSRHQLYDGERYIGVRIGGQYDVGYSESEKLPLDLKNKQVTVTGILEPSIKDTGECMHILHKSGNILTDFKKINPVKD